MPLNQCRIVHVFFVKKYHVLNFFELYYWYEIKMVWKIPKINIVNYSPVGSCRASSLVSIQTYQSGRALIIMSKDPAVLLYTSDFLTGVTLMTMAERGQYITLLCQQHQLGHLPENHMISVCNSKDSHVIKKFIQDKDGNYYNKRMEEEILNRENYCKSRSHKGLSGRKGRNHTKTVRKSYGNRIEDENENENKDVKDKEKIVNNTWRNNFEIYKKLVQAAVLEICGDPGEMEKQQKYFPYLDIKLSLERAVDTFWGTEAGWSHKKKQAKKSEQINMKTTLLKNIDKNKVYKPREDIQQVPKTPYH